MSKRLLTYSDQARASILRGIEQLAVAVRTTLGPKGRNVIFDRKYGMPVITKDGVTVAREIHLQDPLENTGAQMVRSVAQRTVDTAGDGTTTATILAHAIYREGIKNITAGANPMEVKRGIDMAVAEAVAAINSMSRPVAGSAEIRSVGIISANGDEEIGSIIAAAVDRVGRDGVVIVDDSRGLETVMEVVEGMQYDQGWLSPYFVTSGPTMESILERPLILLVDKVVNDPQALGRVMGIGVEQRRPLLVIAEDVYTPALSVMVATLMQRAYQSCATKAPGFGDRRKGILGDIATLAGGNVVSDELGLKLENVKLSDLGTVDRAIVGRNATTLTVTTKDAARSERVAYRVEELRAAVAASPTDYDREKMQERLAKLVGGVAIIRVGGASETEVKEKKMRIDDTVNATRAAVEEGIVPGGGIALLRAAEALDSPRFVGLTTDTRVGVRVLQRAMEEPFRWILRNAGEPDDVWADRVRTQGNRNVGVNAGLEKPQLQDLVEAGVIDPAKVVKQALLNAASVAGMLLTTEVLITTIPDPAEERREREMVGDPTL